MGLQLQRDQLTKELKKEQEPQILTLNAVPGANLPATQGQPKVFNENEFILKEGEVPEGVFYIKSGCVKLGTGRTVSRGRAHTTEYITKMAGPGEFFGFDLLVNGQKSRHFAKAQKTTEVQMYSREAIEALMASSQGLMSLFVEQLIKDMEERENLSQLQYLASVQERIAYQVLLLTDKFGVQKEDGIHLSLRLTRNELAQLAGTINESLSRHLTELKSEGIVDLVGKSIIVKNRQALMEKSGNYRSS